MLGRGVNQVIRRQGAAYPLDRLTSITRSGDLFFVNLECAISAKDMVYSGPPKAFYFRADPLAVETLKHAGVDVVSLANNHALDADYTGLDETLCTLNENGVAHSGAGMNLETASQPAVLEVRDQRIGLVAYCDHQADFAAGEHQPGIHYVNVFKSETLKLLAEEIALLATGVDHVIVSFHWQSNWARHIGRNYRCLAHALVEAGATIVWGHSPHHFQGVEWIDGSVVLYSTGDLVDDYAVDPKFRNDRQLLFNVLVNEQGVEQVKAHPIELEYARTRKAGTVARAWIGERFGEMCGEVGSRVKEQDGWLNVLPN